MNNQELKNLQKELDLADAELLEIQQDLNAGDALLSSFPVEPLPANLTRNIKTDISTRLNKPGHHMLLLGRVAAVIVITFAALSVLLISDNQPKQKTTIQTTQPQTADPDRQLWEFALSLDIQASYDSAETLDTQTITDLLLLFDDAHVSTVSPVGTNSAETITAGIV